MKAPNFITNRRQKTRNNNGAWFLPYRASEASIEISGQTWWLCGITGVQSERAQRRNSVFVLALLINFSYAMLLLLVDPFEVIYIHHVGIATGEEITVGTGRTRDHDRIVTLGCRSSCVVPMDV